MWRRRRCVRSLPIPGELRKLDASGPFRIDDTLSPGARGTLFCRAADNIVVACAGGFCPWHRTVEGPCSRYEGIGPMHTMRNASSWARPYRAPGANSGAGCAAPCAARWQVSSWARAEHLPLTLSGIHKGPPWLLRGLWRAPTPPARERAGVQGTGWGISTVETSGSSECPSALPATRKAQPAVPATGAVDIGGCHAKMRCRCNSSREGEKIADAKRGKPRRPA